MMLQFQSLLKRFVIIDDPSSLKCTQRLIVQHDLYNCGIVILIKV